MESVTWAQARALRLARHHITDPLARSSLRRLAKDICGVHAQVMSACELAHAIRIDGLRQGDFDRALWKRKVLVKTWAMRGTLHLIEAGDLPLYSAALKVVDDVQTPQTLQFHGLSEADLSAALDAIPQALDGGPLTRQELADAVYRTTKRSTLKERIESGWGELLKPAARKGLLCFGPNRDRQVTFVRPDQWIGKWESHDPDDALREVCRRFLAAYGPATRSDFARWLGIAPPTARPVFDELEEELVQVDLEGGKAYVLASDERFISRIEEDDGAYLTGMFDPYVVGSMPHTEVVPKQHKPLVYRKAGWVSQCVLIGGQVAGTWAHKRMGSQTDMVIAPFTRLPKARKDVIEHRAKSLGKLIGEPFKIRWASASPPVAAADLVGGGKSRPSRGFHTPRRAADE